MTEHNMVECVCGHAEMNHLCWSNEGKGFSCEDCGCKAYDPNGHNPEQLNFVCPRCRRTRMEHMKNFDVYYCFGCRSFFGRSEELLALQKHGNLRDQLER